MIITIVAVIMVMAVVVRDATEAPVSMIGTIRVMVAAATTMIGTGPLAEEAVAEEEADHSEGDAVAVGVVL